MGTIKIKYLIILLSKLDVIIMVIPIKVGIDTTMEVVDTTLIFRHQTN